jgi:hypothetical protein
MRISIPAAMLPRKGPTAEDPEESVKVSTTVGVCAILAFGGFPSSTWAALPAATGYVQCSTSDGYITDSSSCSTSTEVATRALSPYATLSGSGSYPGGLARVDATIFAFTKFDFVVTGPDPYAKVKVDIDTRLHQSTVNGGYGFSEILVQADADIFTGPNSAYKVICSTGCADQSTGFDGTLQVTTNPGYISTVDMEIEAGGNFSTVANSGEAYADPHFYIDPSTPDAADYSIMLSPGVGNGLPGVPEPAAWVLMIVGVGGVGAALRRSNRKAATA